MCSETLAAELCEHPDRDFAAYVIQGFQNGFDPMINRPPSEPLECRNNLSARQSPEIVDQAVQRELDSDYVCGPFALPPFAIYRINPLGLAVGKYSGKHRLILDLSAPHKEDTDSINDLIHKEDCSLSYVTIDSAIRIIMNLGPGALLCKFDITDAFKQVPLNQSFWPFFGFKWRDQYYFYKRLAFGCRSSPKIFDHLSRAICWILQNNYQVQHILHLLDDFLTLDHPNFPAELTMQTVRGVFTALNIPLSEKKTVGPTTRLEYLGIILDSSSMSAHLPQDKVLRIGNFVAKFQNQSKCTKQELLSLLGHLNYACRVIPPGRAFISYLIELSKSVSKLHHHVYLSKECRLDLSIWVRFLQQWNGVSFFHDPNVTEAHDLELYTDAATSAGYGGYYKGAWFAEQWPEEHPFKSPTDEIYSIFRTLCHSRCSNVVGKPMGV